MFIDFIMALFISISFNFPFGDTNKTLETVKENNAINIMNYIDSNIMSDYTFTGKLIKGTNDYRLPEKFTNNINIDNVDLYYKKINNKEFALWIIDKNKKPIYSKNSNYKLPSIEPETY